MIDKSNLYTRRKELGLTLEDVAKIVGVSKSTVRKWETGYIENMKRDKIALLAKALKTTPYFIMGIEPEKKKTVSLAEKNLLNHFNKLNSTGKDEAIKRVEELTHFDKYTEEISEEIGMPIAAHNDHPLTEEEKKLMRQV